MLHSKLSDQGKLGNIYKHCKIFCITIYLYLSYSTLCNNLTDVNLHNKSETDIITVYVNFDKKCVFTN